MGFQRYLRHYYVRSALRSAETTFFFSGRSPSLLLTMRALVAYQILRDLRFGAKMVCRADQVHNTRPVIRTIVYSVQEPASIEVPRALRQGSGCGEQWKPEKKK